MSSRYYPLYQRGNPQLRIFLPNFWMKLIRSEEPLPPNMVLFETSIQMTEHDVKNYLEKIYKVPVVDVKTTIKMGAIKKCFEKPHLIKDEDYKEALVTLPKDETFEFPEVSKNMERKKDIKRFKEVKKEFRAREKESIHRHGIPHWFQF